MGEVREGIGELKEPVIPTMLFDLMFVVQLNNRQNYGRGRTRRVEKRPGKACR
jgi:hypothetical protein